jgi:hypothetical protein
LAAEHPQGGDCQQHESGGLQGENDERVAPRAGQLPDREVRDERDLTGDEELPHVGHKASTGLVGTLPPGDGRQQAGYCGQDDEHNAARRDRLDRRPARPGKDRGHRPREPCTPAEDG